MFISLPKEFFVPVLFNNQFQFNNENNSMEYDFKKKRGIITKALLVI